MVRLNLQEVADFTIVSVQYQVHGINYFLKSDFVNGMGGGILMVLKQPLSLLIF